jgi:hypothetical protein
VLILKKNYTLSNNLTLSALNKTEQYSIAGAIDTNFSSLNTAFNYSYIKKWDSKEEWIEPSLFFSSINDFKNNLKNDIYGFNLRGLHISKINMFSGFQINDNGIEKLLNINYGLNRSFFDNTFLASFSTNFIYSDTRKNYLNRLIFNYNKNIPVRILFLNTLTDSYTSNELSGQIDWLSNNSFKFHTNISIRKFFSNISDIFSYSIGLNFAYHVNENLSLSYNPSYYFDNRNNLANYILNNNITSNINLNSHIFNLTLLSQNNLSTNENNLYSFNLSYIYNFFGQVDKPKGEINAFLFEDINNNNILDKEENILKDSSIYINNKKYQSDREGKIKVSNLDYESYNLFIDNSDLPKGYYPTSNKLKIIDLKEKLINVSFGISKKTKLKILSYTNKYKPLENIKIYFDNQTYLSDINGEILVDTTIGNHKIEIDNNSIPKGFFMITSIDENIDVKDNKTEIFLSFQPLISIKGIIKPQKEINLSIDYIKDEIITDEKQVKTQKDGRFYILNIDADKIIIKLNDKNLKEIEIPEVSQVIDLRLDID